MHPDLMRELANQRISERHARADESRLARAARKLAHARRGLAAAREVSDLPQIPDYVDAMFRETDQRHAPDTRHAA
jgi:hypothetical protein